MSAPVAEIPAAPVAEVISTPTEAAPTPAAEATQALQGGKSLQGGKRRGRPRIYVRETRRSVIGMCGCRNLRQSPRRRKSMSGGAASPSLSGGKRRSRKYARERRKSRLLDNPRCTCRNLMRSPYRKHSRRS